MSENKISMSEMVERVSALTETPKAQVERILKAYNNEILEVTKEGKTFTIVGFGVYSRRFKKSTTARNPKNPSDVRDIPARYGMGFKPSKAVKESFETIEIDPSDIRE